MIDKIEQSRLEEKEIELFYKELVEAEPLFKQFLNKSISPERIIVSLLYMRDRAITDAPYALSDEESA